MMNRLFEQIAKDYMPILLNWAFRKVGDREKAEDLTQEVLMQIFTAIRKNGSEIADPEHFVWKIAHYTWCNYVRGIERGKKCISMENLQLEDPDDFAGDYAEEEYRREMTLRMRRQVSRLNSLQRDIMISHYIEGLSVQRIAEKKQMTESAVKWHLFQTRKKLKKEITTMENKDYVYRPRKLHMALSGEMNSKAPDIVMIKNSLTKQNICLACYDQARTTEELSDLLGIPAAYVESDLEWLVKREFVEKTGSGYATSFPIISNADEQGEYGVFLQYRSKLLNVITEELTAAQYAVREIGFYGSDRAYDRLLWLLIYQFCRSLHISYPDVKRSVRMDGGNYLPLGFERADDGNVSKAVDTSGWAYNGSMCINNFSWFGMYNFGESEIEGMMFAYTSEGKQMQDLLCQLIDSDFHVSGLDEEKKFILAKLAQKGFVTVRDDRAFPTFCIFTEEQYRRLKEEIFAPIAEKLAPILPELVADMEAYYKGKLPRHLRDYYQTMVALGLKDIAFLTTFFAFEDGFLYRPADGHDGEFLTLMYVR